MNFFSGWKPQPGAKEASTVRRYAIEGREEIARKPHLDALKRLGLDRAAAVAQCVGVTVREPGGKRVAGFGVMNEAEGLEAQLPDGKPLCDGTRSYTRIPGREPGAALHVFPRIFDYLAFLSLYGLTHPRGEAFILHRLSMVEPVITAIRTSKEPGPELRRVVLWLGNNGHGLDAADRFLRAATQEDRLAATMNHVYDGYPSLFDWYHQRRPARREAAQLKQYDDTAWAMVRARPSSAKPGGPS